jgi:hypothetical protein
MKVLIEGQRRKTKMVGIRLYKEEYELISTIAKKKKVSRSFVAESLIRAVIGELKQENHPEWLPPPVTHKKHFAFDPAPVYFGGRVESIVVPSFLNISFRVEAEGAEAFSIIFLNLP